MKLEKSMFKFIYIVAFFFLAIYQPPIFSFNVLHGLLIISIIYILKNIKYCVDCIKKNIIIVYIGLALNLLIYVLVFLFTKSTDFLYGQFVMCIEAQIIIVHGILFIKKNNLSFSKVIISSSLIQSVISIFSFLIPNFQNLLISICVSNGFPVETFWFLGKRFFGISQQLTFTMPIVQIIIGIYIIDTYFDTDNKIYCFLSIPIFFSAVINSRSSIVILFVGFVYLIMNHKKNIKMSNIKYMFILGIILLLIVFIVMRFSNQTFIWITDGLKEIGYLFKGENVGYFDALFNDFIFFPKKIFNLLFGEQVSVFRLSGMNSDVGYINEIWYIGIIGTFAKYIFLLYPLFSESKKDKFFIYLIICLLISNIKGIIFENNEVIMLTYFYMIYMKSNDNSTKQNEKKGLYQNTMSSLDNH